MFQPDPSLTHVAARRDQIVSVVESINHPQVGVPGYPTQVTQACVVGFRRDDGAFSIYICLYLAESRAAVVYNYSPPAFPLEQFAEVEADALLFMESMGFMVDNANFRALTPDQQMALMDRLPCFYGDIEEWEVRHGQGPAHDESAYDDEYEDFGEEDDGAHDDEPGDDILDLSEESVVDSDFDIDTSATAPILEPDVVARVARVLASF